MANQKALSKAARQISQALTDARTAREAADMPAIISRFKDAAGGTEGLADMLMDDFRHVRGDDLPAEAVHERQESVIQKYHQMIWKGIQAKDDHLASLDDLSGVDEVDLKATLMSLAMDVVREDPEFRRAVAIEALKEDPSMLTDVMRQAGINVIETPDEDHQATD